jgi:predicted ribosome quality control (RQC) complex YloA/Tae2 family protein
MSMAECKNEPADSVNAAVEEAFNARTALEAGATSSKRLASDIAAAVAARRGQIATALAWEREAAGADRLRQLGDNVLAAGDSIVLTNGCAIAPDLYGDGGPAAIAAEPGQPPRAIADGLYKRSRKLLAGVERQRERRRLAEEEIGALQDALHSMDGEGDARRILEIRRTLMAANLLRPEQAEGQARPSRSDEEATRGVRRYRTRDGWEVLLGINAEGNDALLRMCSPDDLWFHVRSGRSAHVAIRTAGRPGKVPPATIRFAALMTARHSRAKHSSMVPVDYTERKHVRRRKGTAHGSVTYRNERTLDVCPDTEAEDAATD